MSMNIVRLGRMDYAAALAIQEKILAKRQNGEIPDVLLLVEHPPVLTVGRSGSLSNVLLGENDLQEMGVQL